MSGKDEYLMGWKVRKSKDGVGDRNKWGKGMGKYGG